MFDPFSDALRAAATRSGYAYPLVFAAGAATSLGPCVAPRLIAVASVASRANRRGTLIITGAFMGGLIATYASFGAVASLLGRATHFSSVVYLLVAAVLGIGGLITLWRGPSACAHAHQTIQLGSAGAVFLLGCSFALVVSPCCTPLVAGIIAYSSSSGDPLYASALLSCFALGHALPVLFAGAGANGVAMMFRRFAVLEAAGTVSAALMLGLAAYYMVLA